MKADSLVNELLLKIPEIKQKYNEEMELWEEFPGNHNIFGDVFNPFLLELLVQNVEKVLIERVFCFLESMALSEDMDVQNVLMVTVLERIGDSKEILNKAKKYMGDKTIILSDKTEKWLQRS